MSLGNPLNRDKARQDVLLAMYDRMCRSQFMMHEALDIPQWVYAESQTV